VSWPGLSRSSARSARLNVAKAFANAQKFTPRKSSQPMILLGIPDIFAGSARLDFAVARQYVSRGLERVCPQGRAFSDQAVSRIRTIP
jgi:hypothetical protein